MYVKHAARMAFLIGFPAHRTLVAMAVLIAYAGIHFHPLDEHVSPLISTLLGKAHTFHALSHVDIGLSLKNLGVIWCS